MRVPLTRVTLEKTWIYPVFSRPLESLSIYCRESQKGFQPHYWPEIINISVEGDRTVKTSDRLFFYI